VQDNVLVTLLCHIRQPVQMSKPGGEVRVRLPGQPRRNSTPRTVLSKGLWSDWWLFISRLLRPFNI